MDVVTNSIIETDVAEKRSVRKTGLHILVFCVLLVAIMLGMDWYVDSFYSVRLTYNDMARIQLENGLAIAKEIDGSERKMKLACLEQIQPVEQMVLGSSRSMSLTQADFPEKTFFNMAVSGGQGINDYLAVIYWIAYYDKMPSEMLIEVSPSMFNANLGDTQYLQWGDAASYMQSELSGIKVENPEEVNLGIVWKDVFSPSYFRANVEQLRRKRRVYAEPASQDIYDTYYIFQKDGSWMYSVQAYEQYTQEMIAEETAKVATVHDIYQCGDFYSISDGRKAEFEQLMDFLAEKGVKVSFYLPPYSPQMYAHIKEDETCDVIREAENYVLQYAKDKNLKVYGSYDPEESHIEMTDFFDPYHLRKECVKQTLWER